MGTTPDPTPSDAALGDSYMFEAEWQDCRLEFGRDSTYAVHHSDQVTGGVIYDDGWKAIQAGSPGRFYLASEGLSDEAVSYLTHWAVSETALTVGIEGIKAGKPRVQRLKISDGKVTVTISIAAPTST